MNNNTLTILNYLLDRYESSSLFKGIESNKRILINTSSKIYKDIFLKNSYSNFEERDKDLSMLEKEGFIYINKDFHGQIIELWLNIDNVNKLYNLINRDNPKIELERVINHLNSYDYQNDVINKFINDELDYIDINFKRRLIYYSSLEELDSILLVIDKIYKLDGEVMERDFSSEVLGDSKLFKPLANKVARIIKDFDESIHDTYENNDDLFTSFGLVKNYTYAMMKNNLVFSLNDQIIDLNKLGYEYLLDDKMIKSLKIISGTFNKVITVENLTSFHKLDEKDALIIYLAGFHNHTKQMLLKKIHQVFPNVNYYHWSDIDVGGFRIFNSLKTKTGINFIPYKMSVHELKRKDINFKPLEVNDIKSLKAMLIDPQYQIFHEAISYMLENNIKLEQENLD